MTRLSASDFLKWAADEIETARTRLETCEDIAFQRGRIAALRDLIGFIDPPKTQTLESPAHYGLTAGPRHYA